MMGNILAIRERAKTLKTSAQKFAPFGEKLSQLAEAFQISEIQIFLQQYMEEEQ